MTKKQKQCPLCNGTGVESVGHPCLCQYGNEPMNTEPTETSSLADFLETLELDILQTRIDVAKLTSRLETLGYVKGKLKEIISKQPVYSNPTMEQQDATDYRHAMQYLDDHNIPRKEKGSILPL